MKKEARLKMYTILKYHKADLTAEMFQSFSDSLLDEPAKNLFRTQLNKLFDLYLERLYKNDKKDMRPCGEMVEQYRTHNHLEVEEVLKRLEEVRMIMEERINALPADDLCKRETIVVLYDFFLDLQKEAYLATAEGKNKELLSKEVQLSQLKQDRLDILGKLSTSFAHEIRNPLTSVKGFIKLLEERTQQQDHKYFEFIYSEMQELEDQVSQILLLSQEKNHEDMYFTRIWINDLICEVTHSFEPILRQNNIKLETEYNTPVKIRGLKDQVKLVMLKLIQNACDALLLRNDNRVMKISLSADHTDGIITFSNNGPPVSPALKDAIFEPFVGTKELGKGLGLAVSKQLMRKHEGFIKFRSENEWTVFELRFPLEKAENGLEELKHQ